MELGAPLLAVLTPQERVAILAHELSHGANGDPLRGQYLLGAVSTVAEWAEAMRPTSIGQSREGVPLGPFAAIIAIPIELALLGVSELLFRGVRGFYLLVLRQSQRAEYLADLLAANVSGSFAMCTALEKTYLSEIVDAAIQELALNQPDLDIKTKLFGVVNELGDEDLERYRETSRREEWQVDSTHPPTALRVDMLQLQHARPPKDLLSAEEWSLFDEEVVRLVALMRQELVNQKLEAVYG